MCWRMARSSWLELCTRPSASCARVSANEAQAIGDSRSVISAEQTYASANCGYYGRLEILVQGAILIPAYPANAPEFLGVDIGRAVPYTKSGYQRNFDLGANPVSVDTIKCAPPGDDLLSYCYTSTPAQAGLSGVRAFSGTAAGTIFVDTAGTDLTGGCPPVVGGTTTFLE